MAALPKTKKLVTIENGTLAALAANKIALGDFPFLRALIGQKKGCGCKRDTSGPDRFAAAKRTLAGMASDKKTKLKRLLNTEQARLVYRDNGGKMISLTF